MFSASHGSSAPGGAEHAAAETDRRVGHTRAARRSGASEQEVMEAIWVAAEMRAVGAYAHSVVALDAMSPRSKTE